MTIFKDEKDITEEVLSYVNEAAKSWRNDNEESFQKSIISLIVAREHISRIPPPWMQNKIIDAIELINLTIEKLNKSE